MWRGDSRGSLGGSDDRDLSGGRNRTLGGGMNGILRGGGRKGGNEFIILAIITVIILIAVIGCGR